MSDDVSDHHEAFQVVFENAGVGLGLAAPDGQFLAVNDALCRMLRYQREVLLTKTYLEITYREDLLADRELAERYISGEIDIFSIEKRYIRGDGSLLWVRVTVSAVRDAEGHEKCSVAIIEDIESRKHIENQLTKARDNLEQRVESRTSELRAANRQLEKDKSNLRKAFEAQDNERRLVACELHDGPAQHIAVALWGLESFAHKNTIASEKAEEFHRAIGLLRNAIAETRRIIGGLRPPIIDEEGLQPALEHLAMEHGGDVTVDLTCELGDVRLPKTLENAIFRISQEALTNIRRHSQSKTAAIHVSSQGDQVDLAIEDWGVGFEIDKIDPSRFGILGIRERARVLGGNVTIASTPGQGTKITAQFLLDSVLDTANSPGTNRASQ